MSKPVQDPWSRRTLLQSLSAGLLLTATPARWLRAADSLRLNLNPFALGVASGCPTPDGVVLWTRLLPPRERAMEFELAGIPITWEVATDEQMQRVVQRGQEYALPEWAHSVHIELTGLQPGREYWYRFTAAGHRSVIGRTRTAPALDAKIKQLRFAVACCQKYENGYYVAYRHMLDDQLDFVVHVGDYIYEYASRVGGDNFRGDGSNEIYTLEDYRARYALYKSDPHLQAAHAAYPWLVTWDDHESANDYAGDTTYDVSGEEFLLRRTAAYRAYYEHMPLPRRSQPQGVHLRLHGGYAFGRLAQVNVLDSRQYRSPLACLRAGEDEGPGARCAALYDEVRTKLGREQEAWLHERFAASDAQWNVLAQGTPMTHIDLDDGPGAGYRRDAWDGYPAARQRLLDAIDGTRLANPVVVDGDIHAFQIANINRTPNNLTTPIVASEFTATSITAPGAPGRMFERRMKNNPNLLLTDGAQRGYLLMNLDAEKLRAELVTLNSIKEPNAGRGVLASYIVEHGKPGPVRD